MGGFAWGVLPDHGGLHNCIGGERFFAGLHIHIFTHTRQNRFFPPLPLEPFMIRLCVGFSTKQRKQRLHFDWLELSEAWVYSELPLALVHFRSFNRERGVVGLSLLSIKMDYRQLVHNLSDLQPKFSPYMWRLFYEKTIKSLVDNMEWITRNG